jgi:hypothetical protein
MVSARPRLRRLAVRPALALVLVVLLLIAVLVLMAIAGETTLFAQGAEPEVETGTGQLGWWILAALIAAGIGATRSGRATVKRALESARQKGSPRAPVLRGVRGEFAGLELELGEEPVIIGRDPRVSQLVFVADAPAISGRHCSVRFDPARRAVVLEDLWSTNGTFRASGERLRPGEPALLRSRDEFCLGDRDVAFEVRY